MKKNETAQQEAVKLLVKLLNNYIQYTAKNNEESAPKNICSFMQLAQNIVDGAEPSEEAKARMYRDTIYMLNGDSEKEAFQIRLKALSTLDVKWIEEIEYLWEVL